MPWKPALSVASPRSLLLAQLFSMRVFLKGFGVCVQLKEAAAAALARLQQDKAREEPDVSVPSLEERVSGGVPARGPAGAFLLLPVLCKPWVEVSCCTPAAWVLVWLTDT